MAADRTALCVRDRGHETLFSVAEKTGQDCDHDDCMLLCLSEIFSFSQFLLKLPRYCSLRLTFRSPPTDNTGKDNVSLEAGVHRLHHLTDLYPV